VNTVLSSRKDGVVTVTLNRPEKLNAVNDELIDDLSQALVDVSRDQSVRVLVLQGAGRAFCAGADRNEATLERTFSDYRAHVHRLQEAGRLLAEMRMPTVAVIRGYAIGAGCELALCCDLRVAEMNAKIGFPEATLGATVTNGGTKFLAELIGMGRARYMLYTGDLIDARIAGEWGLVEVLTTPEDLEANAAALVNRLSENYPQALQLIKNAVRMASDAPLLHVLQYETESACLSYASRERMDGMQWSGGSSAKTE
jgi:enoyl-CoA hydratase